MVKRSKEDTDPAEGDNDVPTTMALLEDFDNIEEMPARSKKSSRNIIKSKTSNKRDIELATYSTFEQEEDSEDSDSSEHSPTRRLNLLRLFKKSKGKSSQSKINSRFNNEEKEEDAESVEQKPSRKIGFFRKLFKSRSSANSDDELTSNSAFEDEEKGVDKTRAERSDKAQVEIDYTNDSDGETVCCFRRRITISAKKDEKEERFECTDIEGKVETSVRPSRSRIMDEKMPGFAKKSLHSTEIKVATMESIQENDGAEQEIVSMGSDTDSNDSASADITFECEDTAVAGPATASNVEANINFFLATRNNFDLSDGLPSPLSETVSVISIPLDSENWDMYPMLFGDIPNPQMLEQDQDAAQNLQQIVIYNQNVETARPFHRQTRAAIEEKQKQIAAFFATEQAKLEERERKKFSRTILISDIDITEEEMKKFRQSLKHPGERDILYSTVETALNFVEKLSLEHRKKKGQKGKAKKREQSKKDPLRPMLWLVFNRISNEKVLICTPGDYVDADLF